jgi:hypothetical protein
MWRRGGGEKIGNKGNEREKKKGGKTYLIAIS